METLFYIKIEKIFYFSPFVTPLPTNAHIIFVVKLCPTFASWSGFNLEERGEEMMFFL